VNARKALLVKGVTDEEVDAYRLEVIQALIARCRSIPVGGTALVGPQWYGQGWEDLLNHLEDIADYRKPDYEEYPGELERLRALTVNVRVGVKRDNLSHIRRTMQEHIDWEAEARRQDEEKTGKGR
jgi:hypothetical protein